MLRQDFNGYKDFTEKVMSTTSEEETSKVCVDRIQMWSDKIMNVVNPLPGGGCTTCNRSPGNYNRNTS